MSDYKERFQQFFCTEKDGKFYISDHTGAAEILAFIEEVIEDEKESWGQAMYKLAQEEERQRIVEIWEGMNKYCTVECGFCEGHPPCEIEIGRREALCEAISKIQVETHNDCEDGSRSPQKSEKIVEIQSEEKAAGDCNYGCGEGVHFCGRYPQSGFQDDVATCPHGLTTPFCPDCIQEETGCCKKCARAGCVLMKLPREGREGWQIYCDDKNCRCHKPRTEETEQPFPFDAIMRVVPAIAAKVEETEKEGASFSGRGEDGEGWRWVSFEFARGRYLPKHWTWMDVELNFSVDKRDDVLHLIKFPQETTTPQPREQGGENN